VELTTPPAASVPPLPRFSWTPKRPSWPSSTGGWTWSGVGLIVVGMARPGWDVQLTADGDGHCGPRST
jgi:hypothetical protein